MSELARRGNSQAELERVVPHEGVVDQHGKEVELADEFVDGELMDATELPAIEGAQRPPELFFGSNGERVPDAYFTRSIDATQGNNALSGSSESGDGLYKELFPSASSEPSKEVAVDSGRDTVGSDGERGITTFDEEQKALEAGEKREALQAAIGRKAIMPGSSEVVVSEEDGVIDAELMPMDDKVLEERKQDIIDAEVVEDSDKAFEQETEVGKEKESSVAPQERKAIEAADDRLAIEGPKERLAIEAAPVPKELMPAPVAVAQEPTRLRLVTVDQSVDAHRAARAKAQRDMTGELKGAGFVKRWLKGNALKDIYNQLRKNKALSAIEETGDIYIHESDDAGAREAAILATIDTMASDQDEMRTHGNVGERREVLAEDSEIAIGMKDFIARRIRGDIASDAELQEEAKLFLDEHRRTHPEEVFGTGLVEVNNLLATTEAVRVAMEQGEKMEDLIANMSVVSGESRSGARTERTNIVERLMDKLGNHPAVGALGLAPEAVGLAAAVATAVVRVGSKSVMHAAMLSLAPLTFTGVGFVGSGILAGLRENMRTRDDRAQEAIEGEQGRTPEAGDKRRNQIAKVAYDRMKATDMLEVFDAINTADLTDQTKLEAAITTLASIEARIDYSEVNGVAVIEHTSAVDMSQERRQLAIARAEAKALINANLTPDMRTALGMDESKILDEVIGERSDAFIETFDKDRTAKDRAFHALQVRRFLKSGSLGVITSAVGAIAGQEILAMASDSRQGLIEQIWQHEATKPINGEEHRTLLDSMVNHGTEHHAPSANFTKGALGGHEKNFSFSNDQTLSKAPDGTFTLTDPNGHVIAEHLAENPNGSLTQASIDQLNQVEGGTFDDTSKLITSQEASKPQSVSLREYMKLKGAKPVTRDFDYENNTPAPIFDLNEQKLDLGGVNGSGITKSGSYQFNIGRMTNGGSFEGSNSAHVQELIKSGHVKLTVVGSDPHEVFLLDVNKNGTVDIHPGDPAAPFFKVTDGKLDIQARDIEAVQTNGVDSKGVTHIRPLATIVGNDTAKDHKFTVPGKTPPAKMGYSYRFTSNGYEQPAHTFTEAAGGMPIVGHKAMGPTSQEAKKTATPVPIERPPVPPESELEKTIVMPAVVEGEPIPVATRVSEEAPKVVEEQVPRKVIEAAPVEEPFPALPDNPTIEDYQVYSKAIKERLEYLEKNRENILKDANSTTRIVSAAGQPAASTRIRRPIGRTGEANRPPRGPGGSTRPSRTGSSAQKPGATTPRTKRIQAELDRRAVLRSINTNGNYSLNDAQIRVNRIYGPNGARLTETEKGKFDIKLTDAGVAYHKRRTGIETANQS